MASATGHEEQGLRLRLEVERTPAGARARVLAGPAELAPDVTLAVLVAEPLKEAGDAPLRRRPCRAEEVRLEVGAGALERAAQALVGAEIAGWRIGQVALELGDDALVLTVTGAPDGGWPGFVQLELAAASEGRGVALRARRVWAVGPLAAGAAGLCSLLARRLAERCGGAAARADGVWIDPSCALRRAFVLAGGRPPQVHGLALVRLRAEGRGVRLHLSARGRAEVVSRTGVKAQGGSDMPPGIEEPLAGLRAALRAGDRRRALAELERVAPRPGRPGARRLVRALAQVRAGLCRFVDPEREGAALRAWLAAAPDDAEAWWRVTVLRARAGDWEGAARGLSALERAGPPAAAPRLQAARALVQARGAPMYVPGDMSRKRGAAARGRRRGEEDEPREASARGDPEEERGPGDEDGPGDMSVEASGAGRGEERGRGQEAGPGDMSEEWSGDGSGEGRVRGREDDSWDMSARAEPDAQGWGGEREPERGSETDADAARAAGDEGRVEEGRVGGSGDGEGPAGELGGSAGATSRAADEAGRGPEPGIRAISEAARGGMFEEAGRGEAVRVVEETGEGPAGELGALDVEEIAEAGLAAARAGSLARLDEVLAAAGGRVGSRARLRAGVEAWVVGRPLHAGAALALGRLAEEAGDFRRARGLIQLAAFMVPQGPFARDLAGAEPGDPGEAPLEGEGAEPELAERAALTEVLAAMVKETAGIRAPGTPLVRQDTPAAAQALALAEAELGPLRLRVGLPLPVFAGRGGPPGGVGIRNEREPAIVVYPALNGLPAVERRFRIALAAALIRGGLALVLDPQGATLPELLAALWSLVEPDEAPESPGAATIVRAWRGRGWTGERLAPSQRAALAEELRVWRRDRDSVARLAGLLRGDGLAAALRLSAALAGALWAIGRDARLLGEPGEDSAARVVATEEAQRLIRGARILRWREETCPKRSS